MARGLAGRCSRQHRLEELFQPRRVAARGRRLTSLVIDEFAAPVENRQRRDVALVIGRHQLTLAGSDGVEIHHDEVEAVAIAGIEGNQPLRFPIGIPAIILCSRIMSCGTLTI